MVVVGGCDFEAGGSGSGRGSDSASASGMESIQMGTSAV